MLVCEVKTSCLAILVWADGHFLVVGGTYLSLKQNRVPTAMKAKRDCLFALVIFMAIVSWLIWQKRYFLESNCVETWWPQNPRDTPRNETESPLKPAQIQVTLPSGYLCTVVGNGTADPLGEKAFFKHLGKNWREIAGIISYRLNSGTPLNFTRLDSWWELGNSPWVWQHCAGALRQDLNNDGWNDNPMSTIFSGSWSSEPQGHVKSFLSVSSQLPETWFAVTVPVCGIWMYLNKFEWMGSTSNRFSTLTLFFCVVFSDVFRWPEHTWTEGQRRMCANTASTGLCLRTSVDSPRLWDGHSEDKVFVVCLFQEIRIYIIYIYI